MPHNMAHPEQARFCLAVKARFPEYFTGATVLDVGSLDINGCNRPLFEDCLYTGLDLGEGKNVDVVGIGHEYDAPDGHFDTIISTECFEHDQHYPLTLKNIVRMLRVGGLFLFTCATTGRQEHGTRRSLPGNAPLLQGEWADYYRNLTEADIREAILVDTVFPLHEFEVYTGTKDLYFWGIKA